MSQPHKVTCAFCGRDFSTKGTYGRHLDSKKGDLRHPHEEVEALRKHVVRRGERDQNGPEVKKRRSEISKRYNEKLDVKERNRSRRRERDMQLKAKLAAYDWFMGLLPQPSLELRSFPYLVATLIPANSWPADGALPSGPEFNLVLTKLTAIDTSKSDRLYSLYGSWKLLPENEQRLMWERERSKALCENLKDTSLWEVANARKLVKNKQAELYDQYAQRDLFDMIASEVDED